VCQPRCFLSSSTRRPDRRPGAPLPRTLRAFANEARVPRGRASPIAEPIPSPQGPSRIVLVGRLGHTWGMLQGATADNPGHSRTRRPPGPPGRTLPARTQLGGMPSMACKRSIAIPLLGRAVRTPRNRSQIANATATRQAFKEAGQSSSLPTGCRKPSGLLPTRRRSPEVRSHPLGQLGAVAASTNDRRPRRPCYSRARSSGYEFPESTLVLQP
jgi:hypothetical protein